MCAATEEWTAYLSQGLAGGGDDLEEFFSATPVGSSSAAATATASASTPAGGAAAPSFADDLFASPVPARGSPAGKEPSSVQSKADALMDGFAKGGGPARKTLAQMSQQNDDFLMGGGEKPRATAPALFIQETLTYYEALGVGEMCSQEEIKTVYKQKSLQLHPDRNPNAHEDDKQMFKLITKAYETLSDPQLRAQYDLELRMKRQPQQAAQPANWLNHLGQQQPRGGMGAAPPAAPFGSPGFGGGAMPQQQSPPQQKRPSNDPFSGLL